ncbi:hypothetical protein, partial [Mesorhizobium sp.]|uniref:hypothetical protein n=1 Tax=Mesorhizobium sp. TaxID=1871066 RepID=UPI00257D4B7E
IKTARITRAVFAFAASRGRVEVLQGGYTMGFRLLSGFRSSLIEPTARAEWFRPFGRRHADPARS